MHHDPEEVFTSLQFPVSEVEFQGSNEPEQVSTIWNRNCEYRNPQAPWRPQAAVQGLAAKIAPMLADWEK